MEINRVAPVMFDTLRSDAEYYSREFLRVDTKLRRGILKSRQLGELVHDLKDGPGGWGVSTNDYTPSGVPVIRSVNVDDARVDLTDCVYISELKHEELKAHEVIRGDVVLSVRGSIGRSAVFDDHGFSKASMNAAVARMRCNPGMNPYYLVAFFNSYYGRIQTQRISNGAVQKNMNLTETRSNWVPTLHADAQQYIGDKLRQAASVLDRHQTLGRQLKNQMQQCFRGHARPIQKKHSRMSYLDINPLRMEAEYYEPVALWAEEEIRGSQWAYEPISELATRIKDGPGGWGVSTNDYVSSGVPVVRGVNLENGECDLTDCVFLTAEKHKELRSHCTYRGNVLLSVRGTIGRSAVFDVPEYEEASLNAAVVTIECRDSILPHFLAEFFNSEIGCIQSARIANGAVQQNMNLTETGNNLIVVPPKNFQESIVAQRLRWLACRRFSKALVLSAKSIIEDLIEGHLSEGELIEAQHGSSRGDNSLDRLIMSRLHHAGINGDEKPVVDDLDALYSAISESQSNTHTNGDDA